MSSARSAAPTRARLGTETLGKVDPLAGSGNAYSPPASAALGELCGRAARVEFFEGHARSGDARGHKYAGVALPWAPASRVGAQGGQWPWWAGCGVRRAARHV